MYNKKAVSEIVSYVILIVIAISLSAVVFVFLQQQIPKQSENCDEGVSLIIKDYTCYESDKKVNIVFSNRGTFKIDGIYARYSNESERVPSLNLVTNKEIDATSNQITDDEGNIGFLYFGRGTFPLELSPNRDYDQNFSYSEGGVLRLIQIQPFNQKNREIIICSDKTITQTISCN